MKLGLCLCGGGAKGAYQAGVIKALCDKGINEFYSISGTSIGAINGYYLFTENVNNLQKMWINILKTSVNAIKVVDNFVDNSEIIDNLKELNDKNIRNINFYVNYIEVKDKKVKEVITNLSKADKEERLNYIKYSSSLPFKTDKNLSFSEFFKKSIESGVYDNYKLDGGLINNTLIRPLIEDNVDKILIISTDYNFTLPKDIDKLYNLENIIVIRPNKPFEKNDTLRFEPEFCKERFLEGYEIGKNLSLL